MSNHGHGRRHGSETLDAIAELWAEKLSTSRIGAHLGLTKNSVCRLARDARLKGDPRFPVRGSSVRPKATCMQGPRGPKIAPAKPMPGLPPLFQPAPRPRLPGEHPPIHLLERHECRYPVQAGADGCHRFCAERQVPGSPYCLRHTKLAYTAQGGRLLAKSA